MYLARYGHEPTDEPTDESTDETLSRLNELGKPGDAGEDWELDGLGTASSWRMYADPSSAICREPETSLCALLQSVPSSIGTENQQSFSQCSTSQLRVKAGLRPRLLQHNLCYSSCPAEQAANNNSVPCQKLAYYIIRKDLLTKF